MSTFNLRTVSTLSLAALLAAALGGCVFASGPPGAGGGDFPTQQLEIHTILDHSELAGVGCVLSNGAGRWFVLAPGRVTVQRSRSPLTVDCARAGEASAVEVEAARPTSVFDGGKLIGKIVVGAGMDGYVQGYDGLGVAYQPTLTVLMRPARGASDADGGGNPLF